MDQHPSQSQSFLWTIGSPPASLDQVDSPKLLLESHLRDSYKQRWLEALVRAEYEFGQVDRKKLCKLMVVTALARSPWEVLAVWGQSQSYSRSPGKLLTLTLINDRGPSHSPNHCGFATRNYFGCWNLLQQSQLKALGSTEYKLSILIHGSRWQWTGANVGWSDHL